MCNNRTNNNITYAVKDDNNVNTTTAVATVDRITTSARPETATRIAAIDSKDVKNMLRVLQSTRDTVRNSELGPLKMSR